MVDAYGSKRGAAVQQKPQPASPSPEPGRRFVKKWGEQLSASNRSSGFSMKRKDDPVVDASGGPQRLPESRQRNQVNEDVPREIRKEQTRRRDADNKKLGPHETYNNGSSAVKRDNVLSSARPSRSKVLSTRKRSMYKQASGGSGTEIPDKKDHTHFSHGVRKGRGDDSKTTASVSSASTSPSTDKDAFEFVVSSLADQPCRPMVTAATKCNEEHGIYIEDDDETALFFADEQDLRRKRDRKVKRPNTEVLYHMSDSGIKSSNGAVLPPAVEKKSKRWGSKVSPSSDSQRMERLAADAPLKGKGNSSYAVSNKPNGIISKKAGDAKGARNKAKNGEAAELANGNSTSVKKRTGHKVRISEQEATVHYDDDDGVTIDTEVEDIRRTKKPLRGDRRRRALSRSVSSGHEDDDLTICTDPFSIRSEILSLFFDVTYFCILLGKDANEHCQTECVPALPDEEEEADDEYEEETEDNETKFSVEIVTSDSSD